MPKITFVGDQRASRKGRWQKHFAPQWPRGLAPGQSVELRDVPHAQIHGANKGQFLIDGKRYDPVEPKPPKKG